MLESRIAKLQANLVENLKQNGAIQTNLVESAFQSVPRHLFLPEVSLKQVYSDQAIAVKRDLEGNWTSSSSQPAIMALMLEQLELLPGQRVLEIGAGSGFNAALIASIVGPDGKVVTMDIQPDLVARARKHLNVAGYGWVRVVTGDGGVGYPPDSPYDRMIVTASSSVITTAWRKQLADGGILVLPLDIGAGLQKCIAFRHHDQILISKSVVDAGFMPLQGNYAAQQAEKIELGMDPNLYISSFHGFPVLGQEINNWFAQPQTERMVGLQASLKELLVGFVTWLTVQGIGWAQLNAVNQLAGRNIFPAILGIRGERPSSSTLALLTENSLAAIRRPPGQEIPLQEMARIGEIFHTPFDVYLQPYGPNSDAADWLDALLHRWDQDGRPPADRLQFRAIPAEFKFQPSTGEYWIQKHFHDLVVRYEKS